MKKNLIYGFLGVITLILVNCKPTPKDTVNPHEMEDLSSGQSSFEIRADNMFSHSDFSLRPLEQRGAELLNEKNLINPVISTSASFKRELHSFNTEFLQSLKDEKASPILIKYYLSVLKSKCFRAETKHSCNEIEALSRDPLSHHVAVSLLSAELHSEEADEEGIKRLFKAAYMLRSVGETSLSLSILVFNNISKFNELFSGTQSEKQKFLQFIELSLIEIEKLEDLSGFENALESLQPELLGDNGEDPQKELRLILMPLRFLVLGKKPSLLETKLRRALKGNESSLLNQLIKANEILPGLNLTQETSSVCLWFIDKVYFGRIALHEANTLLSKFESKESCLKTVESVVAGQIALESQQFFNQIRVLVTKLKDGNESVANADLLTRLKGRFADKAAHWTRLYENTSKLVDFAIINFSNGQHGDLEKYQRLKKSILRNIVVFVELPLNLALLPTLEEFNNKSIGMVSIVNQNISSVVDQILNKSQFVVDFKIKETHREVLSRSEILLGFGFALQTGVFTSLGTSAEKVLHTIAKNYRVDLRNAIVKDLEGKKNLKRGKRERQMQQCLAEYKYKTENAESDKVESISLSQLDHNLFLNYKTFEDNPVVMFRSRISTVLRGAEQEYLYSYSLVEEFYSIYSEQGDNSPSIERRMAEAKQPVEDYIQWYFSNLVENDKCQWAFMKENWRRYISFLNYEAEFLRTVHEEMTQMREGRGSSSIAADFIHESAKGSGLENRKFISKNSFTYNKVALLSRLAVYYEKGFKKFPAIVKNVDINRDFNNFKQDEFSEQQEFHYNSDKEQFVENILKFLLLKPNVKGFFNYSFLGDDSHYLLAGAEGLSQIYMLHQNWGQQDLVEVKKEIYRSIWRLWSFSSFSSDDWTYGEDWVIKQIGEHEKFNPLHDKRYLFEDEFYHRGAIRSPYGFLSKKLLMEKAQSSISNDAEVNAAESIGQLSPLPSVSKQFQDYWTRRGSILHPVFPIDNKIIAKADRFQNLLIKERYIKVNRLLCELLRKPEEILELVELPDTYLKGRILNLDKPALKEERLVDQTAFRDFKTSISQFLKDVPEEGLSRSEENLQIEDLHKCEGVSH